MAGAFPVNYRFVINDSTVMNILSNGDEALASLKRWD